MRITYSYAWKGVVLAVEPPRCLVGLVPPNREEMEKLVVECGPDEVQVCSLLGQAVLWAAEQLRAGGGAGSG